MSDAITLTLPRAPGFHPVAQLVLGGIAAQLDLTIEDLEDLQLAVETILDGAGSAAGEITVQMRLRDGELETLIGPLTGRVLDEIESDPDGKLGVRRVLESTVDDVFVDGTWVRLTTRLEAHG